MYKICEYNNQDKHAGPIGKVIIMRIFHLINSYKKYSFR